MASSGMSINSTDRPVSASATVTYLTRVNCRSMSSNTSGGTTPLVRIIVVSGWPA